MKSVISACLWFWGVLFAFGSDAARYFDWPKTGLGLSGASVIIFGILVWFHFWGYRRVKNKTGA